MANKKCTRCGEIKSITRFYFKVKSKNKRQPCCMACQNDYHNNVYYPKNREHVKKRVAQYKKEHKVGIQKRRETAERQIIFTRIRQILHNIFLEYSDKQMNLKSEATQVTLVNAIVERLKRMDLKL